MLLLIFTKSKGKDKLQVEKTFTYGKVCNIKYEDSDSPNIFINVERSGGTKRARLDEGNLVAESCHPKSLRKDMQTKNNLIVSLRRYVIGEMQISGDSTKIVSEIKS